jgi:hypothetical protein
VYITAKGVRKTGAAAYKTSLKEKARMPPDAENAATQTNGWRSKKNKRSR